MTLTDEQLRPAADFYGVTIEEARRRHEVILLQGDNPEDPICIGCARRPHEIPEYVGCTAGDENAPIPSNDDVRRYVIEEEGTYNRRNGHFLCDEDYIRNGMPSADRGWVCP